MRQEIEQIEQRLDRMEEAMNRTRLTNRKGVFAQGRRPIEHLSDICEMASKNRFMASTFRLATPVLSVSLALLLSQASPDAAF